MVGGVRLERDGVLGNARPQDGLLTDRPLQRGALLLWRTRRENGHQSTLDRGKLRHPVGDVSAITEQQYDTRTGVHSATKGLIQRCNRALIQAVEGVVADKQSGLLKQGLQYHQLATLTGTQFSVKSLKAVSHI